MKRIKVLVCGPTQGVWGGIEAFQAALGRFIAKNPDFEVKICYKLVRGYRFHKDLLESGKDSAAEVHFVKRGSFQLFRLISWSDVVHGQNSSPDICFYSKFLCKPLVLTLHNYLNVDSKLREITWQFSSSLAKRRWYNSCYVRNSWETSAPSHTSEAFPTVSFDKYNFSPITQRRGFVSLSRWIPNKGIEVLLEAYRQSAIDKSQWPLHMMGSGPLLDEITAKYKHVEGVTIHGFVSEEEKRAIIRSAMWLVAVPHTGEDMGLTPLEARSNGIPCVVTRDGGLPEVAGDEAYLVEPNDVNQLKLTLEDVSRLSESKYAELSETTFLSVQTLIRPMSFYTDSYRSVVRKAHDPT